MIHLTISKNGKRATPKHGLKKKAVWYRYFQGALELFLPMVDAIEVSFKQSGRDHFIWLFVFSPIQTEVVMVAKDITFLFPTTESIYNQTRKLKEGLYAKHWVRLWLIS